ncbi:hypothetical protein GYMLUDRAFT_55651 [Collybiopsis luxurians FD-317 M1]|nr:hypothetical protein GYMLUDRAFT_55651 [Collybiopsis luxurians FD-317 M1]
MKTTSLSLAIVSILASCVSALNCASCPTIVDYEGTSVLVSLATEHTDNSLECDYTDINNVIPFCWYDNESGVLVASRGGTACPSVAEVVDVVGASKCTVG